MLVFLGAVVSFSLAACGSSSTPTPTSPPAVTQEPTATPTSASTPTQSGPTVMAETNSTLGTILVDGAGKTLYLYTPDSATASNCTGGCATVWPPFIASGGATAGVGVTASMLGTITRSDGSTQVTYNGHPLYYYSADTNAGDVNGQGFNNVWYTVAPSGAEVKGTPTPAPTQASSTPGY